MIKKTNGKEFVQKVTLFVLANVYVLEKISHVVMFSLVLTSYEA